MCSQIPFASRIRCAVRHPGTGQFKFFTIHIFPLCRCKCQILMRGSDKADMCFVCSQLKCHMHGWNLSCCLKDKTITLTACDRHSLFHISFVSGIDDFICTKAFRQFKAFLTNIKNYHFLGTKDLGPLHGKHSNCTTAKNCDILATVVIILEYTVDCNSCRLKHGSLLIWNTAFKRNGVLLRNNHIICVTSLLSRAYEAVMLTEREISLLTVITFHTWKKRCTGNTVSHFYLSHTFPHFHYISGKLMSKYDWIKMDPMIQDTRNV